MKEVLFTAHHLLYWGMAVCGFTGIVVLAVYGNRRTATKFKRWILTNVADYFAQKNNIAVSDALSILDLLVKSGTSHGFAATIEKIEVELTKQSATRVQVTIAILSTTSTGGTVAKITHTSFWDELPSDVRKEFILRPSEPQVYAIYKRNR